MCLGRKASQSTYIAGLIPFGREVHIRRSHQLVSCQLLELPSLFLIYFLIGSPLFLHCRVIVTCLFPVRAFFVPHLPFVSFVLILYPLVSQTLVLTVRCFTCRNVVLCRLEQASSAGFRHVYKSKPSLSQENQNSYYYTLAYYQYSLFITQVVHNVFKTQPKSSNMFKTSLVLLALSLTTLSLPTAEEGLQKRWAKGWITSYELSDTTCKSQVGHRPKWDNACLDFTPTTARIGKWTFSFPLL